jgi:hypothetical protein
MDQSSRRRAIVTVAILLTAGGVVVPLCLPVVTIDQVTCDRIHPGMTVDEVTALVGGPPGWYEGISSIGTNAPAHKGDYPTWCDSRGEIVLTLDDRGRVAEANYYPVQVLSRSLPRWAWERWTRNAFGTGRTKLVVAAAEGTLTGLGVACPLVFAALGLRARGLAGVAYGLCLVAAAGALSVGALSAGLLSANNEDVYGWLGGSASALVAFAVGSVWCGGCARPNPSLNRTGAAHDLIRNP